TPASGEPRRGLRSAAAVELLTSFCLCFLKKPVRQDGVYGAVTMILVPYFWSAAYGLLLAVKGETYENDPGERSKDLIIAGISVIYAVWLIYAGGLKYLLLSALLYAPGVILFAKAKHEVGQPIFTNVEKLIFAVVVIGALIAAYGLYDGFLTL
ncbi:hypothetical protein ABZQ95_32615, partial [Pseudomonas aeruginosa]